MGLVTELKSGTEFIEDSLAGVNDHNINHIGKLDAMLAKQDHQIEKTESVIDRLADVQGILRDGFRLKE